MISLLIITHEMLGDAYTALVQHFFPAGDFDHIRILRVEGKDDHCGIISRAQAMLPEIDQGNGVLILTDIFGATPCNAAMKLIETGRSAMVTGLNAPMLIKAVSHSAQSSRLAEFTECVRRAGINGIMAFVEHPA